MSKKQVIIVVGLAIALLFLFMALLFKYEQVPDVKWSQDYKFESKEPYGGWMFNELLTKYYEDKDFVYHYRDTMISEIDSSNNLLVKFGDDWDIYGDETAELYEFAQKGNDVLIIGRNISIYNDSIWSLNMYNRAEDSLLSFQFLDKPMDSVYQYQHYYNDFKKPIPLHFYWFDRSDSEDLAIVNDSFPVFIKYALDSGFIHFHSMPQMFSNQASRQEFYLDHFNRVFSRFDPELVILDHPSLNKGAYNRPAAESPIQYILSEKSLSSAYYLLLFAALLFVIFKSKRKQRAIPVVERNTNTSLEYVQTLSNLFASQDQSAKLIPHIKNYFYHKVKSKYYLDEKNPNFVSLLAKKSKVEEKELEILIKMLNRAEQDYAFPDDQLVNLHRRVEKFYKIAK